jgi:DNA-binding NtrC family response regulator
MPRVWQMAYSFFASIIPVRLTPPSRAHVVALLVNEQDRCVVTSVSSQEALDVHFAESCDEARAVANQLTAPVILIDRDWPGTGWRATVESLAASPHHACVILVSRVADVYLWQELIRCGGYDVLAKPLRANHVARVVKLALSYWTNSPRKAEPAGSPWR